MVILKLTRTETGGAVYVPTQHIGMVDPMTIPSGAVVAAVTLNFDRLVLYVQEPAEAIVFAMLQFRPNPCVLELKDVRVAKDGTVQKQWVTTELRW